MFNAISLVCTYNRYCCWMSRFLFQPAGVIATTNLSVYGQLRKPCLKVNISSWGCFLSSNEVDIISTPISLSYFLPSVLPFSSLLSFFPSSPFTLVSLESSENQDYRRMLKAGTIPYFKPPHTHTPIYTLLAKKADRCKQHNLMAV